MAADSQMSPIGDADKTVALQHPPRRHLGCNAAIDRLSADNVIDDSVNRVPARQEGVLVAAHRLADIEVDIAVTDMPERQDAPPRHEALDGRHRIRQEACNVRYGHGNIMLDGTAFLTLHIGHNLARPPESLGLLDGRRQNSIRDEVLFHGIRQQRFHHRVDADVFVDTNGLIYATDFNAGLYVMEYTG
jgi:hypothetical protein